MQRRGVEAPVLREPSTHRVRYAEVPVRCATPDALSDAHELHKGVGVSLLRDQNIYLISIINMEN